MFNNNNNNNGRNGSCLTWLIEEKRRWLIINASLEDNVLNKFRTWKERHNYSDEGKRQHD